MLVKIIKDILISTPEKFLMLAGKDNKKSVLDNFQHIILDEADKFFEYSYMDQLNKLLQMFSASQKHFMLFSATLPVQVEKALEGCFLDKVKVIVGGRVNVLSTIEQKLVFCQGEDGKTFELSNIINEGLKVPCIVFVQNKERVRQLYR